VTRKRKRLTFVLIGLGLLGAATALVLSAIEETLVFFRSPTELAEDPGLAKGRLRLGGLVEEGSVSRGGDATVHFRVTDLNHTIPITYRGILPDLFREGQGIVAEGRMQDGVFLADTVLAKHDENYMPPEVADALKKSGQWQDMRDKLGVEGEARPEAAR
jgi:cytochrome c-type biogenesis protein CcmE